MPYEGLHKLGLNITSEKDTQFLESDKYTLQRGLGNQTDEFHLSIRTCLLKDLIQIVQMTHRL